MISWEDVVNIAPALSAVPAAAQAAILDQVYLELAPATWGSRLHLGAKWLAAHLGSLHLSGTTSSSSGSVTTGPITSESVGPVSRSFASGGSSSSSSTSTSLSSTQYGQQFERLRDALVVARIGDVI